MAAVDEWAAGDDSADDDDADDADDDGSHPVGCSLLMVAGTRNGFSARGERSRRSIFSSSSVSFLKFFPKMKMKVKSQHTHIHTCLCLVYICDQLTRWRRSCACEWAPQPAVCSVASRGRQAAWRGSRCRTPSENPWPNAPLRLKRATATT